MTADSSPIARASETRRNPAAWTSSAARASDSVGVVMPATVVNRRSSAARARRDSSIDVIGSCAACASAAEGSTASSARPRAAGISWAGATAAAVSAASWAETARSASDPPDGGDGRTMRGSTTTNAAMPRSATDTHVILTWKPSSRAS